MGKFIAIYGVNNIGKSWHAKHIVEKLKQLGKNAAYLKYPIYDIKPTGPFLNETLRSGEGQKISEEELQMWYALNRFQFQDNLSKLIENHDYVVAEDYTGTGICWGYTKGADLEWLESLNDKFIKPDINILIVGERKKGSAEKVHIHETNNELLDKAQNNFDILAEKYGWKTAHRDEDYEITKQNFWKILVAQDDSLR